VKQHRLATTYLEAGIPFIMTGKPGIGKTAWLLDMVSDRGMIVHDHREALNLADKGDGRWAVIQVMGSIREAEDLGGYPVRSEHGLTLEPTIWAQSATHLASLGWTTVVFFDEFRDLTAPKQAALQKVMHENLCGDLYLSPYIRWAAAANSVEDSTSGIPISAPMANRLGHIAWTVSAAEWCEGMLGGGFKWRPTLSPEAIKRLPPERALIASFIDKRRNLLTGMPENEDERDGAWPSPRSWDNCAQLLATVGPGDYDFRLEVMASIVGLGTAKEFIAWQRELNLPDPEDVLSGKVKLEKVLNKNRPDIMYAVVYSVTSAVLQKLTPDRWEKCWAFLSDCAEKGIGDVAITSVITLMRKGFTKENLPRPTKYLTPFTGMLKKAGFAL
jgi:hypothetical protein